MRDDQGRKVGVKDAHVWHCSLSLRADDRALTDEEWARLSEQFVERMGFTDTSAGQPPCRWVALRQGVRATNSLARGSLVISGRLINAGVPVG